LKITCSILLSLLFCLPALAQNFEIKARVVDSSNHEPVAFSTLYIDEYSGTISDEQGFFRLQVSPEKNIDTLHISCIGYHSKSIPVLNIDMGRLDTIYLQPGIIELSEVQVQAKSGKTPGSKKIIKLAIGNILNNYPDIPVMYNGYYREYVRKEEEYINLFESIINLEDPGFQSIDNFEAGLLYKRINTNFQVDSLLMRPYDNLDKFVPYSNMPIQLNNELVILRAHDPVRNYNRNSLYFIERLEKDFLRNHNFSNPKLTYQNDRPYYLITYKDNRKYTVGINRITTSGSIYIDAFNYGIRRISYGSTIDDGNNKRKLFGLNLEYKLEDDVYLLHYLSFNNLFNTRNFAFVQKRIWADMLDLTFSKPINPDFHA